MTRKTAGRSSASQTGGPKETKQEIVEVEAEAGDVGELRLGPTRCRLRTLQNKAFPDE